MPKKLPMTIKRGRKKSGMNKGYFYYAGRGWFALDESKRKIALTDETGERIRDRKTPDSILRAAFARFLTRAPREAQAPANTVTVFEVVDVYCKSIELGNPKTFEDRSATLFDLCTGFPPRFRRDDIKSTETDRIHSGLGPRLAAEIIPLDITQWLQAHKTWKPSGYRTRLQAVKRAFNYAVEMGLLEKSPLRGMKIPKPRPRVTYLTDEQEAALLEHSSKAFRLALRVLLRTGARPGIEFAKLTAKHVADHGDRMEWTFQPEETKNKRLRVIRITAQPVIKAVREQMAKHKSGPLFRNADGEPWQVKMLSQNFRRTLAKIRKRVETDLKWDADVCVYSARHTYAKRTLQGYWSGKPTNIETLARLMGHSVQVCRDHYLQWTETYNEPLWDAC